MSDGSASNGSGIAWISLGWIREALAWIEAKLHHVSTDLQLADMFTQPFPSEDKWSNFLRWTGMFTGPLPATRSSPAAVCISSASRTGKPIHGTEIEHIRITKIIVC